MALIDGVPATAANFNAAFLSRTLTYGAIVGSSTGCTHDTLVDALSDVSVTAGSRILLIENQTISTTITISKANLIIESLGGVTLTNDSAVTCFTVAASGTRIKGIRFSGFTTAISISSTFNNNLITECRFDTCTNEVVEADASPNNVILGNITE